MPDKLGQDYLQPEMYRRFLAQCYVALSTRRHLCDHLLWITWAPFSSSVWHEHRTPGRVRQAVLEHRKLLFGDVTEAEATALVNDDLVKEVADRLWLIVICSGSGSPGRRLCSRSRAPPAARRTICSTWCAPGSTPYWPTCA